MIHRRTTTLLDRSCRAGPSRDKGKPEWKGTVEVDSPGVVLENMRRDDQSMFFFQLPEKSQPTLREVRDEVHLEALCRCGRPLLDGMVHRRTARIAGSIDIAVEA